MICDKMLPNLGNTSIIATKANAAGRGGWCLPMNQPSGGGLESNAATPHDLSIDVAQHVRFWLKADIPRAGDSVGAAGLRVLTLRPTRPGPLSLRLLRRQEWESEETADERFVVEFNVR